jgi:transposase
MLCHGNVMSGINAWSERILSNLILMIDDNRCRDLFDEITEYQKLNFFKLWRKHLNDYCLQYYIASIDCYDDNIGENEVGITSEDKKIKQANLAIIFGHNSKLPISYEVLQGNVPDKQILINTVNSSKTISKKITMYIMDHGFETKENLRYMHNNKYNFIAPLPESSMDNHNLFDKYACKVYHYKNRIHKFKTYGLKVDDVIYDIPINAHIYFNLSKAEGEDDALENMLLMGEKNISKIKDVTELKNLPEKFLKYFQLADKSRVRKNTIRNNDNLIKISSRHGYFILITNDKNLSSEDVLKVCKKRDAIQTNYSDLKSDNDISKLSTHKNNTSNGKLFVAYIALIIRAYILQKLNDSQDLKFSSMSIQEILRHLSLIDLRVNNGIPSVAGIGPSQKRIMNNLKISPDIFLDDFLPVFFNGEIPIKICL